MVSASVLRSLASKIARVSPRLPAQEVFHGRRPDPVPVLTHPSRPFSSSPTPPTGSTPPSTNQKVAVASAAERFNRAATTLLFAVMSGTLIYTYTRLIPKLDEFSEILSADHEVRSSDLVSDSSHVQAVEATATSSRKAA